MENKLGRDKIKQKIKMISLLPKLILYKFFHWFGWPRIMPINISISLTYKCNSRCKTCNIWQKKGVKELSLEEYKKIFKSIGRSAYEIILTGGEPFLRNDIVEICQNIVKYIKPKVIIIPTNGFLTEAIVSKIQEILKNCPKAKLVINLSLDEIEQANDWLRGLKGSFSKALRTYKELKRIKNKNLNLRIHTVISKFNVDRIPQIYQYFQDNFEPDAYITEIAEERIELGNINSGITPSPEKYFKTIDFLISEIKEQKFSGLNKITQAFRIQYYQMVKKILKDKKELAPCYAGIASLEIMPDGDVWACCIKGQSLGNLRDYNYDFKKIWKSQQADRVRKEIKDSKCFCPLANASYTNILLSLKYLPKVILKMTKL